jgi:hypothetical protein
MPIPLICPCSAKLRIADHLKGQYIKCPRCGAFHAVGAANGAAAANGRPAAGPPALPDAPADTEAALAAAGALSEAERDKVREALEEGEHVLWADKPDAQAAFRYGWIFTAIVGAVALLLVLISVGANAATGDATGLVITMSVIALLPLSAGLAAPFFQRWRYQKNVYAFTNRRALAWACDPFGRIQVRTYSPAQLTRVQCTARADGMGSLLFYREFHRNKRGQIRWISIHGFLYLRNAPAIEKQMREQLIDPFTDKISE